MKLTTRAWAAGCAGAVVVLAAGGWFVGVQPQLAHADEAGAAAAVTEAQVGATQSKVAVLSKAAASQADLEAKVVVLDKAVPAALQANTFVRRVNTVAALDAVDLQSIAVGTAVAYTAPAGAATTVTTATPAPSASATPAPSDSTAAAAPVVVAAPVLAATDPLISAQNLSVVPMTIVVKGTGAAGLQFVKDLQRDERLYLISGFTTSNDPDDATNVTTTLTGSVYALKA